VYEADVQKRRGRGDECKARVKKTDVEGRWGRSKSKGKVGVCSKTEVVGAHGTCCGDGALLRAGARSSKLVVKPSLCC
jgi:hypothetical protein